MTAPDSALRASGTGALRLPAFVLCVVFFLSGSAALLFETLWFRMAGLTFGNSVWASALVLSSFMAGLAIGNGIVARHGGRIRRPVRLYAGIEVAIAVFGVGLVLLFPVLSRALAPAFRPLLGTPTVLNAVRITLSFLLLCLPAVTMGMTLPLLVKALRRVSASFGIALGRLYGWNTIGAVVGALLGELVLIERFGIVGTSLWAAGLDLLAAVGALAVAARLERTDEAEQAPLRAPLDAQSWRLLAAAFAAGLVLLALEVVWFRFLQLFFPGTSLTFALMLSVVLAGIGLGGLLASLLFRFAPRMPRVAAFVALAAGFVAAGAYAGFDLALGGRTDTRVTEYGLEAVELSLFLMFPVSLFSGLLFALIGQALQERLHDATRAAGLLTMANTLGATCGPLLAGFLLIPTLGMEAALLILACVYGLVALLLADLVGRRALVSRAVIVVAVVAAVVAFPRGRMQRYLDLATAAYRVDGAKTVATREGLVETIQYLEKTFLGEPYYHRLVTNGYSMSGTHAAARRYMKAYVYWPIAMLPEAQDALLISFGCGSTAKALTDTPELESIVVVDISPEILELASVVYPEPGTNPLEDPRVEVYVEDGRFFLQTTKRRFDLITAEPPPPKVAGVVSLYTREYFQLICERLTEGGMTTYWLPVIQLDAEETRSIIRAFVDVFGDEASLWTGCGLDWMLVGTKNAGPAVSAQRFEAQWNDPVVAPELERLGFETPAQLGATLLMSPPDLAAYTASSRPLTDDDPKRLSVRMAPGPLSLKHYADVMDTRRTRASFEGSEYMQRLVPPAWRARTVAAFDPQTALNRLSNPNRENQLDFQLIHALLSSTSLRAPIQWAFESDGRREAIVRRAAQAGGEPDWRVSYHLAVAAMVERDYLAAERLFAESNELRPAPGTRLTRVYLLVAAERNDLARALVSANRTWFEAKPARRAFLKWLARDLGFEASAE